jgi:hypothetical protein
MQKKKTNERTNSVEETYRVPVLQSQILSTCSLAASSTTRKKHQKKKKKKTVPRTKFPSSSALRTTLHLREPLLSSFTCVLCVKKKECVKEREKMPEPEVANSSSSQKDVPKIVSLRWGVIEVEEGEQKKTFKDCKLWPGHSCEWDWTKNGTNHFPGILPNDLEEMKEHCDVIILSRGMQGRLHTSTDSYKLLSDHNIKFHQERTPIAVQLYNQLAAQNVRVGGLFHSTC